MSVYGNTELLHQPWQEAWREEWAKDRTWVPFVLPAGTPGVEFVGLRTRNEDLISVELCGEDKDAVRRLAENLRVEL